MTTRITSIWDIHPDHPLTERLDVQLNCHPIVARIMTQRGITSEAQAKAFLHPESYNPAPPEALPDLDVAVDLLDAAITEGQTILIWGDFDVDGQTATALLLDALRQLEAEVSYYVPHRLTESHGIQPDRLKEIIDERSPAVLLTCDTGISEHEAIAVANDHRMTVIVTDHHDLPEVLPDAAALINPKRLPAGHPLRTLPGVGVAYKLMEALLTRRGLGDHLVRLLDLVALGIVADVAEQTADTRYLLQLGLRALRTTTRKGLLAIYKNAKVSAANINSESIGFQIAPRLNAIGRLGDANMAVELLTTGDSVKASVNAAQLEGANKQRRVVQRQMLSAAQSIIADDSQLLKHTALVLHFATWHPGLLGIVAGQLAEQLKRPCVLLATDETSGAARGSARSFGSYDIGQAIAAQADLLIGYGGHPGAAGLSLPVENINLFRRCLSRALEAQETGSGEPPTLAIDAVVDLDDITAAFVNEIETLAPFGEGNPAIVLAARNLTLVDHKFLGADRLHRKLTVKGRSETLREVLWWSGGEFPLPEQDFDLAFVAGWNIYNGNKEIALTLRDIRVNEAATPELARPKQQVIDWREKAGTFEAAKQLVQDFRTLEPDGLVWLEGAHSQMIPGANRQQLTQTSALLLFHSPPSRVVLQEILEATEPDRIYIAGQTPAEDDLQAFLRRLLGLCKYALSHKDGQIDPAEYAALNAQPLGTIRLGLELLAAQRHIAIVSSDSIYSIAGRQAGEPDADQIRELVESTKAALAETGAYRAFFARASAETLLP